MKNMKTKNPTQKRVFPIAVTVQDSFANTEFEAQGTVTIHEYRDFSKLVFAKVKTPFGLGTLKLSYTSGSGWSRDAADMPCRWLHVKWSEIAETLAGALAA